MTTISQSNSTETAFGGTIREYSWKWQGQQFRIESETLGSRAKGAQEGGGGVNRLRPKKKGKPVLLLPAFSTVSARSEMGAIARILSSQFRVTALDWLGFGRSDRPSLAYQPAIYHQLLQDFVQSSFNSPVAIAAAGHGAGYALQLARSHPNAVSQLVLVAPTWKGPLRVMGAPQQIRGMVRRTVCTPVLGQMLYYLNTTPSFLRLMYKRHVYVDDRRLTPEFITRKRQTTQATGARFAPAAFVTGQLDPVSSRAEFLAYFQPPPVPVLAIAAENAPPASKAEMEAIASQPEIKAIWLPGTLGMHEEYPDAIAEAMVDFLST